MRKKLSIIGTVSISIKYGGFETLTEYLTKDLCVNLSNNTRKKVLEFSEDRFLEKIEKVIVG